MSNCRQCRFFRAAAPQPAPEDRNSGECRRYPPSPPDLGARTGNDWPLVQPDDWCGEYQAR